MDIQALIAAKQKEMAAKKTRQNTIKPLPGKHTYRLLPSWRGGDDKQFWHDFGMHFIKTPQSGDKPAAIYLCVEKTYGKPCDVCDAIQKSLAATGDDKMVEMLKKGRSGQRYLMNVLHVTGSEPNKVQVMEVGQTVFDSICEFISEYGDITDPDSGMDIVIKREGTGMDTSYQVLPAGKTQPLNKAVLSQLINLDEFVSQETPAGQTKALVAVGEIIGIAAPVAGKAALPAAGRPALPPVDEAEDAEFETVTSAAAVPTDSELDELDELLA